MSTYTMSSLSRAFTTKRNKTSDAGSSSTGSRGLTFKHSSPAAANKYKISAPVELLSTTNMLSYNAPDLYPSTRGRSSTSGSESDSSSHAATTASPVTSPDSSSIESSPTSPKPNHLSCYFGAPAATSASSEEAPKIPQRVPSHTKRSAEAISRKRSISRMSSPHSSISASRSSLKMMSMNAETAEAQPFGNELAQVSELVEEFAKPVQMAQAIDSAEENELLSKGLFRFRAEDYISEISGFFQDAFSEGRTSTRSVWI